MAKSANEIRQAFLGYFEKQGHRVVKSSALVPYNDPTLLFTNAGMVQFKDAFTGKERREYTRAATSQKCLRAGGKHNDLENVGVTARHHTFFEMLGNFSFGDYFKQDAIRFAWEFVTRELGLDPERLCVTVFKGENNVPADEEAAALWHELAKVPKERIFRLGAKDNFWSMGDTGPCGPCSEIHFYQGDLPAAEALKIFDTPAAEDQWIEIWNLVFMQFERFADGRLEALPKPSIDTGMGLERAAAVSNGLKSNYETSLLRPLIDEAASLCDKKYTSAQTPDDVSLRVLADHARATAFLIADGVFPSNEGRGYVLRRIMRRAIRHGERLGFDDVFFFKITDAVVERMGSVYSELRDSRTSIEKWVKNEEEGFRRTLRTGLRLLSQRIARLQSQGSTVLSGADAFELYDTYGFPLDLTEVIVAEQGLSVDQAGFDVALEAQRSRAGAFKTRDQATAEIYKRYALEHGTVRFLGYELKEEKVDGRWVLRPIGDVPAFVEKQGEGFVKATIKALYQNGAAVQSATGAAEVILDPTPFYGESGGQAGDSHGVLADAEGNPLALVVKTAKPVEGLPVTAVNASTTLSVGAEVLARYDAALRRETRAHHSATHLLHKALRDVLGDHVKQAGSLVTSDRLRFDFSHFEALSGEQIDAIEAHVHDRVRRAAPIQTDVSDFEEAKKKGAVALFGEKYGDRVRVLTIGDSVELCGGTHAFNTADIAALRITKEEAIAAGVRRVEAVVADAAKALDDERARVFAELERVVAGCAVEASNEDVKWYAALAQKVGVAQGSVESAQVPQALQRGVLRLVSALRASKPAQREALVTAAGEAGKQALVHKLDALITAGEKREKQRADGRNAQAGSVASELAKKAKTVHGIALVAEVLEGVEAKELRTYADKVRDELGSGVVVLGVVQGEKASVVVAVSKDLLGRARAGEIVKSVAQAIGGSGGGKPDFAQAGGPDVAALPAALARIGELFAAGEHAPQ